MDGWTLLFDLREALHERSDSDWLNDQISYTYLYEAAAELNSRIASITSTQSITTIAETSEYRLNPDFMGLYLRDGENRFYVKLNDGTNDFFITHKSYEDVIYDNLTTSQTIPDWFTIKAATTQLSNVTGTASADGTVSSGEATLTDTSSSTKFSNISAGDWVHNTTSGYHGIVLEKTSGTVLATAIFDSVGTASSWTASDSYVVVPQPRYSIVFEPPTSTAAYTVTVFYLKKPDPVFAPYRSYKFPVETKRELVQYAAGRYKYRDRDLQTGNAMFQFSDRSAMVTSGIVKVSTNRGGFKMNLKGKRA